RRRGDSAGTSRRVGPTPGPRFSLLPAATGEGGRRLVVTEIGPADRPRPVRCGAAAAGRSAAARRRAAVKIARPGSGPAAPAGTPPAIPTSAPGFPPGARAGGGAAHGGMIVSASTGRVNKIIGFLPFAPRLASGGRQPPEQPSAVSRQLSARPPPRTLWLTAES